MYIKGHFGPPLQTDGGVLYTPLRKKSKKAALGQDEVFYGVFDLSLEPQSSTYPTSSSFSLFSIFAHKSIRKCTDI